MKKTLALLLALVLMLPAALALAEDNFNAEGYPIVKEPITITVMGVTGNTKEWDKTIAVKETASRLGINMDITTFAADVWPTQFTLMLADDKLPDLMMQLDMNKAETNGYGEEDYLLDMSQYLDIMPNFKAFCDSHPDFAAYSATADGKIYSINRCRNTLQSRQLSHNWIKKSWLENVGMECPTTIDELYNVLVAFKEKDANGNGDPNDEIPMSLTFDGQSGQRVEFMLRTAFGIPSVNNSMIWMDDGDGKAYLADVSDKYRTYLTWLNKLYEEKLLDNEAFIMTTAEFQAKATADKLGFFGDWSSLAATTNSPDDSVNDDYYYIDSFASEYTNNEHHVVLYPNYTSGTRLMISASTQYPREICRFVDFLYSPEGIVLANDGVEGVTFEYIEDGMGNRIPNHEKFWQADIDEFATMNLWKLAKVAPGNTYTMVVYSLVGDILSKATDEELDAYIAYRDELSYLSTAISEKALRANDKMIDSFPFLVLTAEESAEASDITTDIQNYVKTMKAQFITGEVDIETGWDEYVKTVEGMGLARLVEIQQAAYDRFLSAMDK